MSRNTQGKSFLITLLVLLHGLAFAQPFVHPGCLSTSNDLARMTVKVASNAQPWKGSWDILTANSHAQLSYNPNPQAVICRGGACAGMGYSQNYMTMANDAAAAYQCALRYRISGDTNYANKSVQIMNAWSGTLTNITGDSNWLLAGAGQGYQWACAAELVRDYQPWAGAGGFTNFQNWLLVEFYPGIKGFLQAHNGTCSTHYWANWDLFAMNSVIAIGVVCDRRDIYDEAIAYYTNGIGAGAAGKFLIQTHPGYLGQCQESGRDQGHCTLDPILLGVFCEIAWNQGDDMYAYNTNTLLQVSEYVSKYNVQPLDNEVPFVCYMNCEYYSSSTEANGITPQVASGSRGTIRPGWSLIYHHYANRRGLASPWTGLMATEMNAEGGGGNYGSTSGGYDQLGYTTLTHTLDPIPPGSVPAPGLLMAQPRNNTVTLSWFGSAGATSYNVKRAAALAGPYTNIASVVVPAHLYVDIGLTPGTTNYYAVSAIINGVETTNSTPASASQNLQLSGTVIGSAGSYNSAGAEKTCLFDGTLKNFYDAANVSSDWGGLDLGRSNVITQVAYCPRPGFSGRMVGGLFQGANVPDFTSGVVTLFTVASGPTDGVLTYQAVSNPNAFRYVRYRGPSNGSCNAAEIQFFGAPPSPTPPNAPGDLQAAPGNKLVLLDWSVTDGAMSFSVKRATNSGGPYATIATNILTTTFTDTGLSNFTSCYYVVSAVNAAGESTNSTEVAVTPSPGADLGSLVWSGATNGNWNTSALNWVTNLVAAPYQNGNAVLFDDSASANTTISIPSPVSPAEVTFNNSSKTYTLSGSAITGSCGLTMLGNSWVLLSGANTFSGGVTVQAGTVTAGNNTALGSGVATLNGGALNNSANLTLANNIVIAGTGSGISLGSANNLTLTGTISSNGSLTLGDSGNTSSIYLSGANAMSGGTVTIAGNANYVRFTTASAGSANADWVFNNKPARATFDFSSGTISFGSLAGNGSIQGNVSGAMNVTISVGANNTSTTFSGIIHNNGWGTGPIGLTKAGSGTLTLTGTNDYAGTTAVNAGALVISTISAAKGNYTVANAATFGVTNVSSSSALISNLTVAAGSKLDFQNITSITTPLIAVSNVTVSGSCTVKISGTNGLVAGSSYPLVSYAGTLSGSFANLQLQMPHGWRGELVNIAKQIVLTNVAVVATTPPQMNVTPSGPQLQLAWPATHTGWRLETQTNSLSTGLGTNWFTVSGSAATNQMLFPVSPEGGSVFFRLVYP